MFKDFLEILYFAISLIISVIIHEIAHGWVAHKLGDPTARLSGRLSLNPLKHIDPFGSIILPLFLLLSGSGFVFGWAKPVIINIENIPNSTKQMLVALAGPTSNFLLAIIFTLIISVLENDFLVSPNNFVIMLFNMLVTINIALGVFNLIPIPPLDGSRILSWILPEKLKYIYNYIENYGIFIMILILFTVGFSGIFKISYYLQHHLYLWLKVNI